MTGAVATGVFVTALLIWTGASLLRFVGMYDPESTFQRWRRWDLFQLVPKGAFFGPSAPPHEASLLVRDLLADGAVTDWAESPAIAPRRWRHVLWNPQKQTYNAKVVAANALLAAARQLVTAEERLPPAFLITPAYVALLRYAAGLPRAVGPVAVQFVVIERDLLSGEIVRSVVSAVHEV